jgi:hypothetical protein
VAIGTCSGSSVGQNLSFAAWLKEPIVRKKKTGPVSERGHVTNEYKSCIFISDVVSPMNLKG